MEFKEEKIKVICEFNENEKVLNEKIVDIFEIYLKQNVKKTNI